MTGTVGAEVASSIPTQQSGDFSLYFHVPFCTKKCDYCHFYVIPDQPRFKEIYREALRKEWELRLPLLPHLSPLSIYFGGGTPSLLAPEAICEILSWVSPSAACEITLEVNPENVTLERMRDFYACGINRISMGIQSFDDSLLKALGRTHSAQGAVEAVEICAQAGFENISIDLMYDLPEQTLTSWRKTLTQALDLPITHLSLYNLTIEPHTVFYKKRERLKLPDADMSLEMLLTAVALLEKGGLARYEISAFARGGKISKHNIGYWTSRPFLGFGPSAFSYWKGSRFRNISNLNKYAKSLALSQDPSDFRETLPTLEQLKENLAIGLRLIDGVPQQIWPEQINIGIANLKSAGFLEQSETNIRLTSQGVLFHDTVAEEIISF